MAALTPPDRLCSSLNSHVVEELNCIHWHIAVLYHVKQWKTFSSSLEVHSEIFDNCPLKCFLGKELLVMFQLLAVIPFVCANSCDETRVLSACTE